jgi:hypothetical protein
MTNERALQSGLSLSDALSGPLRHDNTDPPTGALFMKSLSIAAALTLGLAAQAVAAESEAKLKPGVASNLAHKYVAKYDIVTAKVAEGVKFANPAASKGLNPQPEPPSRAIMQSLPHRE